MAKSAFLFLIAALLSLPLHGQIDVINLREDVRGLSQRVAELSLRVEQLERQNSSLANRAAAGDGAYATLTALNQSISDVNRNIQSAVAQSRSELLTQVGERIEKLAKQTNAAIDALAKNAATRPVVQTAFSDDYPKEGVSYTVLKGDTLPAIAKKTGAKTQDIINANKLSDPSRIAAGQTLFIPGGK